MLISISAVSAQNNNSDIITTNNNDDDTISVNNLNNEILTANPGSFADLNATINGESQSIELDRDYVYSSSDTIKDGIVINKGNLTIDGKGHTIDAKGQSRIFYVNSTTVYLKNIKFINGNAANAGAIYGYGDNLRVINCTFINNNATGWGGAIYSYPDSLTVFANSTFINNNAKYGGAILTVYGYRQYVINCTFDSNHATDYGGAVGVYGVQSTTERPYDDRVDIIGSTFINNKAKYGDAISDIRSATLNITNCIILGNTSNLIDVDVYFAYADYNWFGNTYDNRSVSPKLPKYIKVNNWLYMDIVPDLGTSSMAVSINNLYDNNTGKTSTYSTSRLPSIAVDVDADNSTMGCDKVILDHSGKANVNFTFYDDTIFTASYQSSTISKKVKGGSFADLQGIINAASDGDVIKLEKDYIYIKDLDKMTQGIQIMDKHNIVIDGNGHTVNADGKTRVFAVDKSSSDITFKNINIANGYLYSDDSGAGIYIASDNTKLINCTFTGNAANTLSGGGAVYVHASHFTADGCKFINNTQLYTSAGAIFLRGNDLTIRNTLFENNTALGFAGALESHDDCDIIKCTFRNNSADYAGATFNYGHANFEDCTFIGNRATGTDSENTVSGSAGAVYAMNTTLINCVFTYNVGKLGAAIFIVTPDATIDKCIFINNTATSPNGIICSAAKGGKVSNSIFLNNALGYVGANVISCIYDGIVVDYNWFGNIWKNYDSVPDVSNLATMSKWLFLNTTDFLFNGEDGSFKTAFTFMEYDSATKNIVEYGWDDLPEIDLKLSSQNLTLNKNVAKVGESIEGTSTYYKGTLYAEYENVKYQLPFKYLIPTSIDIEPVINVSKDASKYLYFNITPFNGDYILFLINSKRVTVTCNDTSVVNVVAKSYNIKLEPKKVGLALLTIKFNGINVIGEDKYVPSNATVLINVTRIPTHIRLVYNTTDCEVGDSGNIVATLNDYKNRSATGSLDYINNNESVLKFSSGSYRAIGEGLANITINFAGNANYEPCSLDVTFNVGRKPTSISVDTNELNLSPGQIHYLGPSLDTGHADSFNCSSNDTDVAIINEDGQVTAIGPGTAKLTIRFEGNERYLPSVTYVIVKISRIPTHIEVESQKELNKSDSVYIGAVLKDDNNKTVIVPIMAPDQTYTKVYTSNDTSVVTVDENGLIAAVGIGVAKITMEFRGYREYDSSSASVIVKVVSPENKINVDSQIDIHVGENTNINASLEYASSTKLEYLINDTKIVSIDKYGKMRGLSEGVAKITIVYKGDNKYQPVNATAIIRVAKGITTITSPDTMSIHVGETAPINANLTSEWENKNITGLIYESSNNKIVKVDKSTGVITALKEGQANITISFTESNKYYGASKKVLVTVSLVPTTIDVGKTFSLLIDENETINATLNPSQAGDLIFTSGNSSIVTVDQNGLISAVGVGETNITITFKGDNTYAPANASVLVTVSGSAIPTSIKVNDTIEMYVYDSVDIAAILTPANAGKLTFISSNSSIVSVDENGKITANAIGDANVTVKFAGDGARFLGSNETVLVRVMAIPTAIAADTSMTLNLTENETIKYVFSHPDAGNVEFIIEDSSIVSIKNGIVIADKVGKTNVTIQFKGNKNYLASNATVLIEVVDVATSIEASDVTVNVSESASIGAALTPAVGKLSYVSTNSSVVTVDDAGKVTGVKVGEADIIIKFEANGKYRQANKTIHVVVSDVETSIDASDVTVNVTEFISIDASLTPNVGKLSYVSSNESVVTVNDNGIVKGVKVGEADIIIKFEANGKYREATKTIKVKVVDVATSIDASDVTVNVSESDSIDAVLTPAVGKLSYTITNSSVATVDDKGLVKGIAEGEADIIIKFEATGKYHEATKTIHVKVTTVSTEINVNNTMSLLVDENADIGAVLTPVEKGKLSYSSNDSSIVSVDENGKITAIKEGTAAITVSYAGEGKYLPSNNAVTVKVSRIPTNITLDDFDLQLGEGRLLKPKLNPVNNQKNLTYSSNDSSIVEIDSEGFISASGCGNVLITILYAGNEKYLPSNLTLALTITPRVTTIVVENEIEIGFNESMDLGAHVATKYMDLNFPLTYESSNPDIVSVDGNGRITGNDVGEATITIKFEGENSFSPSNATVKVVVTTRTTHIDVLQEELSLYVDDDAYVGAYLRDGPKGAKLTYMSSDIGVVSVDSNGKLIANNAGNAVITAYYAGDEDYHSSKATVNVTVSKLSTKIVADINFPMKVFETIDLHAVLTPHEGILTYSSSDNEIASVDVTGKVTAKSVGSVVVTIKFAGDRKYLASQKQVIVSVSKVPTSINVSDITIYSGEELRLKNVVIPTGVPTSSRYLTFDSGDLEIFDVDEKGVITTYQEGITDLYIEFKGNDIYLPSNATVIVKVIKKTLTADDCVFNVDVSDDSGEATFTLNVPEDATGNFIVVVDGEPYGDEDNIVDGVAVVEVDELAPGDHKVTMRYSGDERYFSVNNQTTIHIYRIKIDKNKDISVVYTENPVYTVHLTSDTQAMENKTVTFKVNGKTYYGKTDMYGYASVTLPKLPIKTYTITASYKGIKVTNKIISKHIVIAKNINAKKTKTLKVQVTLNKVNKKYLAKKKVTLKFNGKTYSAKTNKKGVATFTIAKSALAKLKVGKSYIYKVTYSKDTVSKKIKIVK